MRPVITWLTGPEALSAAIRRGVAAGLHQHHYYFARRTGDSSRRFSTRLTNMALLKPWYKVLGAVPGLTSGEKL